MIENNTQLADSVDEKNITETASDYTVTESDTSGVPATEPEAFDALEAALDELDDLDFDLEDLEDKIAPLAL